jgi:excisionase family DNA binding protein
MELLTVQETAKMLKVSQMTVRRYIASGKLKAVRVGRNIRIRRDDAERIIEPVEPASGPWAMLIGNFDDDGPTDIAENHDKYLAAAYADTHEDDDTPFTNPDGDTTLTPREWLLKNDPMFWTLPGGAHEGEPEYIERTAALIEEASVKYSWSRKPLTAARPKRDHVGMVDEDAPTNIAEDQERCLPDAFADTREEEESPLSRIKPKFAAKSVEWRLKNHPLIQSIGFIKDGGPDDYSVNHDKYLADAYADNHEE